MPNRRLELTGKRFGRLTVVRLHKQLKHSIWLCRCKCGRKKLARGNHLKDGNIRSCGCLLASERLPTRGNVYAGRHGFRHYSGYAVWQNMMRRCYDKKCRSHKDYGKKGIRVCKRWHDLRCFAADMGVKSKGMTIERLNPTKDYKPSNCKWVPRSEQNRNKRNSVWLVCDGRRMLLEDWSRLSGIDSRRISSRIRHLGWTSKKAIWTPALVKRLR